MDKIISVIVPVYNVEAYVEKCIKSVLSQTYQHFELILLNDGSTDMSYNILMKYKNNPHVTIIDKKNTGQSDTRYQGLLLAKGEYVYFVDSDDTIEPDALETLVENSLDGESDAIFARYRLVNTSGKVLRSQSKYTVNRLINQECILSDALRIHNLKSSLWLKMVKRSILLRAYNKDVMNLRINEDVLLSILIAMECKTTSFSNNIVYNVLQRDNSVSRSIKSEIVLVHNIIFPIIKERLETMEKFNTYYKDFYYGYSKSVLYALIILAQKSTSYDHFLLLTNSINKNDCLDINKFKKETRLFPVLYRIMILVLNHKSSFYCINYLFRKYLNF